MYHYFKKAFPWLSFLKGPRISAEKLWLNFSTAPALQSITN